MKTKILGADGKPIVLTRDQANLVRHIQNQISTLPNPGKIKNAGLGYEVDITTLTAISQKISEQKFYTIPFAQYVPVTVGNGTWQDFMITYRSFDMGGAFEDGYINQGGGNARLASVDTGVDSVPVVIKSWAKEYTWSLIQLQQASKSGNWDLVTSLEKSRKKNWDLGLQRIAFLGANGNNASGGSVLGLLNQPGITENLTTVSKPIKNMDPDEFKAFCSAVYEDYRANCNRTAKPNVFLIPESDYNGLAGQSSPDFPIKSTKQVLEDSFKEITQNQAFQVLPCAYADSANSEGVLSSNRYALYNYDEESIRMDIPLDYTNTMANTINGFQFQSVAYGQHTGVVAYRPQELLYFKPAS